MHILVSNDDGYQAPGLACLVRALERFGRVSVVAPDRDRSGASNSLTLERPLRATTAENGFLYVNGTPTDCVHLAITGLLEVEPDMVISGINAGPNLGDDVIYSGTVAAAMEGRFLGLPALAVSLVTSVPKHYESAACAVGSLIGRLRSHPLAADTILNVNVPDCPWDEMKGFMATRLGHRHKSEPVTQTLDPRGRPIYWVGPAGPEQDAGPGTDFYAVSSGFISVTPIQVDLTEHRAVEPLSAWLQGCGV